MTIRLNIKALPMPTLHYCRNNDWTSKPTTLFRLQERDMASRKGRGPWLPKFELWAYAVCPIYLREKVLDHEDMSELIRLGFNRRFVSCTYLYKMFYNIDLGIEDVHSL